MIIEYMSRQRAADIEKPTPNCVLVSISEPGETDMEGGTPLDYDKWKHVLKMIFHDVDMGSGVVRKAVETRSEIVPFNDIMASDFIKAMKTLPPEVDTIIIHCHAGISRSTAVAKFLGEQFFKCRKVDVPLHNKYVYSTLMKVWDKIWRMR